MSDKRIDYNLDVPFKEFMPGQIIQSVQFNDNMEEVEEKVNEIIFKHNLLVTETEGHLDNIENPHSVTAHQVGTYTTDEIDEFVESLKNAEFYDKSVDNRVLEDESVDTRVIKNKSITAIKVDDAFGNQIDISKNMSITDRYTKEEVNNLLTEKVGEGTYSKEELNQMFEDVQAGQIVDGTIDISKLKDNVGRLLDISANKSITDRYTKEEVDVLIQENGLPRDWGGLEEIVEKQHYGHLPVAEVMTADEFVAPSTPVLDIDVREVVGARNGHDNLGERLNSIDSQLEHNMTKVNEQFNTIAIQVSNEIELKKALINIRNGGLIQLKNDIEITEQLNINKYIVFDGCGFEIKCMMNGLHEWFKVSSTEQIIIKNCKFNDNLKGRVILTVQDVNNINLIDCKFTGYSKEFGYYETDGLVRFDSGCKNIVVEKCEFFESGYNYSTQSDELNRCITVNDTLIEHVTVKDCKFYKINQAIVSIAKNLTIDNCIFDSVKDNFIYCLGETLTVENNKFINCQDEVIVTSTKTNFITSNYFKDFSNKAIAINGDLTLLDVKNNTFINSFNSGQVLSFRETPTSKVINFISNTCLLSETLYSNNYPIINTNKCDVFNCELNYIETKQPNSSNIVTSAGTVINFNKNNFNNINTATNCIALNATISDSIRNIDNNIIKGMRLVLSGNNIGSKIETNSQYYTNDRCNILFADSKPLYTLPQGTIVFNSNYTSMLSSAIAWISNGDEWVEQKVFRPFVHEKSNTPINWSSPRFAGDLWIGNAGAVWIGINTDGATSSSWKKLLD